MARASISPRWAIHAKFSKSPAAAKSPARLPLRCIVPLNGVPESAKSWKAVGFADSAAIKAGSDPALGTEALAPRPKSIWTASGVLRALAKPKGVRPSSSAAPTSAPAAIRARRLPKDRSWA